MSKKDGAAYRRGVLIGLTMAEIFILIIFLLLLAFASLLAQKQKEFEIVEKRLALVEKNPEELNRITAIIESDPDMSKELVSTLEGMPELLNEIKNNGLKGTNETTKQVLQRAVEKLKLESQIKKGEGTPEEQLKTALEDKAKLQNEIENLTGQKDSLMKKIDSAGHGGDFPPCWPSAGGKPEYIFNTLLTDDGIIVHDNKIPHRAEEQTNLPLAGLVYDQPMKQVSFIQQTAKLLNWSNEHKCRLYVQVFDRTGPSEKTLYKNLRTTVEGTFYIYKNEEISNESRKRSAPESVPDEKVFPQEARPKTWLERQFN